MHSQEVVVTVSSPGDSGLAARNGHEVSFLKNAFKGGQYPALE
ncbi:MAG: hypothetical protein ABFD81_06075 [Syntrophaceae bacterium]